MLRFGVAQVWSDQMVTTRGDLEELGFQGLIPFAALPSSDVPDAAGVYCVLRIGHSHPLFVPVGAGRAPYPVVALEAAWVEGAEVLYFGKATCLRRRLAAYRRSGDGRTNTHQGGRSVWQLGDADCLLVAWLPTPDQNPGPIESQLIRAFAEAWGALPSPTDATNRPTWSRGHRDALLLGLQDRSTNLKMRSSEVPHGDPPVDRCQQVDQVSGFRHPVRMPAHGSPVT